MDDFISVWEVAIVKRLERVLGGLFGVACGDALGGPLEFSSRLEGIRKYGYHKEMTGGGIMHLKIGEVTDDTAMTMCVADGIIENPDSPIDAIGRRFVQWYNTDPKDIGVTCGGAIKEFIACGDWKKSGIKIL